MCFQCRYSWSITAGAADEFAPQAPLGMTGRYAFTPEELDRLKIYRRAVQVGFFSDTL